MWDIIIVVGVLIIILVLSVVLLQGKGGFLIAGFNMLPREKKEKVDWVNLCKFMGKILLGMFCSWTLILANMITGIEVLSVIGLINSALLVVIALVWTTVRYMAPTRK